MSDEMSRKEFLELMEKLDGPKSRNTTVRSIEGKASEDNVSQVVDQFAFVDNDMTVRKADVISTRKCSFGHILQEHNRLVAQCEICGRYTCSWISSSTKSAKDSCQYTCLRCGKALCKLHVTIYSDGETYCRECKIYKLGAMAWELIKKLVK